MLLVGGAKEIEINRSSLLFWYHQQFEWLTAESQVVIIGYSFGEEHINKKICSAAHNKARLFIVDPLGVDFIDKRSKAAQIPIPQTDLMHKLMPAIDGASRRNLLSTLTGDTIERSKLHHFLTSDLRQKA